MALRISGINPERTVSEFALKFGEGRSVAEGIIASLMERRVGLPIILPVVSLVELSFIDGKLSPASLPILSNVATIVTDVVEGDKDVRGSTTVLQFINMATVNLRRSSRTQTAKGLKALTDMIMDVAEFTGLLSLRGYIRRNDMHEIFGLTTWYCLGYTSIKEGWRRLPRLYQNSFLRSEEGLIRKA